MGASVRVILLVCIIGIISGVSFAETPSIVIENGHQSVVADFKADQQSGSAPVAVQFTDTSIGSPGEWYWDFGDGAHDTGENPLHIYTSPGIYSVSLSVTGPAGSDMKTRLGYIRVLETPVPTRFPNVVQTISPQLLTLSSPVPTDLSTPIPTESPVPIPTSTPVSDPGKSETDLLHLLSPVIHADFIPSVTGGLVPLAVRFTDNSSGNPTGWSWDFGDGTSSDLSSPEHVYEKPGKYTVRLTVQGSQGSNTTTGTEPIDVALLPEASIKAQPRTGSAPLMVAFTDNSTGRINSWLWTFGDGTSSEEQNPVHTYNRAGVYDVSLTISGTDGGANAAVPAMVKVTDIIKQPVAMISADTVSGDAPFTVKFSDISTGDVTTRTWDFGDGGTGAESEIAHTYSKSGTYTARLTIKGPAGESQAEQNIIVNEPISTPKSDFSTNTVSGIAPLVVSFMDKSTGSISSWNWDFGDDSGSSETNPMHTYSSAGSYQASLTVNGPGGSSHSEKGIIVSEPTAIPTPEITPAPVVTSTPSDVPEPLEPVSTMAPTPDISPIPEVTSTPSDVPEPLEPVSTMAPTPEITPAPVVTSTASEVPEPPEPVSMMAPTPEITPAPVVTSIQAEVQETQKPESGLTPVRANVMVAKFTTFNNEGSAPLAVRFKDASIGEITSWTWDFGDGGSSTEKNPSHTYSKPGNYAVSLTVTGPEGSRKSDLSMILVTSSVSMPKAVINADQTNGTAPLTVTFTDGSTGAIKQRNWNFGDTSTSSDANPVHTYTKPGVYTASLIVTGPAGENRTDEQIVVRDMEDSPIVRSTELPVPVSTVQADDDTQSKIQQIQLSTIVPHNTEVPAIPEDGQPETPISYESNTESPGILVTTDRTTGPAPLTVSFSSNSALKVDRYEWLFGDGSSSGEERPVHTYDTPGSYDLTLLLSGPDGQGRKVIPAYITVTESEPVSSDIIPEPVPLSEPTLVQQNHTGLTANISADIVNGTAPLKVSFQADPTGIIDGYAWDFGDGGSSYEQNPIHTYATEGNYSVKLVIAGKGGSDEIRLNNTITVLIGMKTPVSGFTASPVFGYAPLNVSFTDTSSGSISQYEWSMGDGTSSSEQNPSHQYTEPGVYTVGLVVSGQAGNSAEVKKDLITVESLPAAPIARFKADKRSGTAPLDIQFQDLSSGVVTSWNWDLGDGTITDEKDPVMKYTKAGVYAVTLTVIGPGGKDVAVRRGYITVSEPEIPPVAVIYAEPVEGPAPMTVKFLDMSTGLVTGWNWDLGDGTVSTNKNPTHIYQSEGTYSVNLHVSGPDGENGTTTLIRVSPHEQSGEKSEIQSPVLDLPSIEPVTSGNVSNESDFQNSSIEEQENQISGSEKPVAAFSLSGRSGKSPLTITFHDRSTGDVTGWQWVFGDGETSDLKDPIHTYQQPGIYTVALAVTGPDGTSQKRIREAVQVF